MHKRLGSTVLLLLTASMLLFAPSQMAHAQDADLAARLLSAINAARIASGLPPYALNPLLTQAAQQHSEYQHDTGEITHTGPGEMRAYDRVLATGYPALRVNENIYAGIGGPEKAVEWWITADEAHRHNILHPTLREIGIGAATNEQGVTYYTMDLSAQPNTLPVFINNDAPATRETSVTLTLNNEEIFYGAGQIGYATQVMISNSPDFSQATAQPWSRFLSWTLDTRTGRGAKTVYVRYIDAAGVTADAQDTIYFDPRATIILPTIVTVPPLAGTNPTDTPAPSVAPTATQGVMPSPMSTVIIQTPIANITATQPEATGTPAIETPLSVTVLPTLVMLTLTPAAPVPGGPGLSQYLIPAIIIAGIGAAIVGLITNIWARLSASRED